MFTYYVVIALVILMAYGAMVKAPTLEYEENETVVLKSFKNNKIFVFGIFAVLAFVSAFRYYIGADFNNYYQYSKMLDWIADFQVNSLNEPGNALIAQLNKIFLPGVNGVYIIVASVLTMLLIVRTIGKHSDNLIISALLLIFTGAFTGSFNAVRQYLAAAILFAGYRFVVERKIVKWLIVVIIATCFHISALLMFFVYFLTTRQTTLKLFLLYVMLGGVLYFSYDRIFDFIEVLKGTEFVFTEYSTRSVNRLRVLVQCIPLVLPFLTGTGVINADDDTRFLFNISMFNAVISVAAMNSTYFSRFYIYTGLFLLLMYPAMLKRMSSKNRKILIPLLIILYFFYWYYETSNSWALNNFKWVFSTWGGLI